jgi:ABC-2 type transport system ATP-binding protein
VLEIKNARVSYGLNAGIREVTVDFRPGEIVGLFGENGAGKTTLMNAILGYVPLSGGTITLDGKKISRKDMTRISIASSEQTLFPHFTAREHRDFFKTFFPRFNDERYEFLMKFFDLPENLPYRSFSTGHKNQLETILALSQGADYVLLDEPFAGNDIFNREDFYKLLLGILEPSECLIISTHLIEEIKHFVGRVVLIHKTKIVGDKTIEDLESEGTDLISWMRSVYQHDEGRVGKLLQDLRKDKEE